MCACQLGKGRNCREGGAHKQGNWRIFEQPETHYRLPALSRVNPLPQVLHRAQALCDPCGSGFTREEAGAGIDQRLAWR